ncbi:zinc carboxypeptidase A 1 [Drosophila persimilis]|uniref:zinc carboxypeptidase A 1 n=1 Tax=Drosophila persimilis TaxID=7234 RepID=UPI000F095ADE|nr:zinc carboxypeptidase A 1 [Drosophila persimilis]
MHLYPWALVAGACMLLRLLELSPVQALRESYDLARTDNRLRLRLPFFGGGVGQLLHYLRPLDVTDPARPGGRRSELRSELDANHVTYRGWQLWKLNFNATRAEGSMEDEEEQHRSPDAEFNEVVEKFVLTVVALVHVHVPASLGQLVLWRSVSVSDLSGLSELPLALWSLNGSDLYETTFESLQWLSPMDLRRFDFLSPSSSYQINRRYRNSSSVQRYYGHQLWKLHETRLSQPQLRAFWRHFGSEVWNINQDGIDIVIEQKNVAAARQFMQKLSFSYNVMIDDMEAAIDETYAEVPSLEGLFDGQQNQSRPWLEREGMLMTWRRYHDHGDIQQFLQAQLEAHSELVEIVQIGVTRNKRPLEVIRVSNGNPQNWAIFVDAGLQARDWLSPAALTYAISKLTHLWEHGKLEKLMRRIDWYFLPLANPDGYQYSRQTDRLWTKNRGYDSASGCYGVNLDRNFEHGWGAAGSTSNPCKNLYRGASGFSEPETRALRNFLLGMRDYLGGYVSLGGYGQTVTYPWGDADYVTENQRLLKQTARQAVLNLRRLNQAEYSTGTSYRQKLARPGNSADWVQDRIEPQFVYNVFLKDQGRYGYLMPPHYIVESGEEVYDFLRTIAQQLQ